MTGDSPAQLLVAISVWLKCNFFLFFYVISTVSASGRRKRRFFFFLSFFSTSLLSLLVPLSQLLSCSFFPVQCPAHEVRFDSTGVILSPGFPENYPNLQMCSWLINVEKGYNITLHFELFQTEKEFDILEIFDGESLVLELSFSCIYNFHIHISLISSLSAAY